MKKITFFSILCLFFLLVCFFTACNFSGEHTHIWTELENILPTCTQDGMTTYSCTCGEQRQENSLAFGHQTTTSLITPATATTDGSEEIVCSLCDYAETVAIPAFGDVSGSFSQDYVTLGQPLSYVFHSERVNPSHLTYKWISGISVVSRQQTYTPDSSCLGKKLTLVISDYLGNILIKESLFCSRLPVFRIDTDGGAPITSKTAYMPAEIKMIGSSTYLPEATTLYNGDIQIHVRGNFTAGMDKKPYKIKLNASTDLFGFGKSKHWILLANYLDESLVRSTLPQEVAAELGLVAMDSTFVDLVVNGQYVGVYQLMEQVRIDNDRVDIHSWENIAEDLADTFYDTHNKNGITTADRDALEDALVENLSWISTGVFSYDSKSYSVSDYLVLPAKTGGFLIEMSSEYDEISKFKTTQGAPFMFSDPEYLYTNSELFQYAKGYIQAVEDALYSQDFATVYNGETVSWRDLVDLESAAKFWLICDYFSNEIGSKSTYMYIDTDGKLVFGPVWDFDWSAGSESPWFVFSATGYNSRSRLWFSRMIKDPEFAKAVYDVYPTFRASIENILKDGGKLDQYYDYLKESARINDNMWFYKRGFEKDYTALRNWLTTRINWYDQQFVDLQTATESLRTATPNEGDPPPNNDRPDRLGMIVYDDAGNKLMTRDLDVRETTATVSADCEKVVIKVNVYSTAAVNVDLYINGTKVENKVLDAYHATNNPIRYCEFEIDVSDLDTDGSNRILIIANRNNGHEPYENTALIEFDK